jgi:hypothetical protein
VRRIPFLTTFAERPQESIRFQSLGTETFSKGGKGDPDTDIDEALYLATKTFTETREDSDPIRESDFDISASGFTISASGFTLWERSLL